MFADSQNTLNGLNVQKKQEVQQSMPERDNNDTFRINNSMFSRRSIFLLAVTAILTIVALVLMSLYLISGEQLTKQATLGDGDDSRKNIAISSTIGRDI